jgi:hypothetical protein
MRGCPGYGDVEAATFGILRLQEVDIGLHIHDFYVIVGFFEATGDKEGSSLPAKFLGPFKVPQNNVELRFTLCSFHFGHKPSQTTVESLAFTGRFNTLEELVRPKHIGD